MLKLPSDLNALDDEDQQAALIAYQSVKRGKDSKDFSGSSDNFDTLSFRRYPDKSIHLLWIGPDGQELKDWVIDR